jgi:serine/threonine-protein kinase
MGTVQYMSPERARGKTMDARTDIFSLGILLYEMLSGRAPFSGESSTDVLAAILDKEPLPLLRFADDVPSEYNASSRSVFEKIATSVIKR